MDTTTLAAFLWCLFPDRLPGMAGHVEEHGPLIEVIVAAEPEKASAPPSENRATRRERWRECRKGVPGRPP